MSECIICVNECAGFISCPSPTCNFSACVDCWQIFLISKTEPCCMSCNIGLDDYFCRTKFSSQWVETKYKTYFQQLLFDKEKSFVEETIDFVPFYQKIKILERSIVVNASAGPHFVRGPNPRSLLQKRKDLLAMLKQDWSNKCSSQSPLQYDHNQMFDNFSELKDVHDKYLAQAQTFSANQIIMVSKKKCPQPDCRGYLNHDFKCIVCTKQICVKCFVTISDVYSHDCKPNDVETVNLLEKTTKPCPKCNIRIERNKGCSHMFCTFCFAGFDWESGQLIDDRQNTNPHLKEYLVLQKNNKSSSRFSPQFEDRNTNHNYSCLTSDSCSGWQNFPMFRVGRILANGSNWYFVDPRLPLDGFYYHLKTKECDDFSHIAWPLIDPILASLIDHINVWITQGSDLSPGFLLPKNSNNFQTIFQYNQHHNRFNRLRWITKEMNDKQFITETMKTFKRVEYNHQISLLLPVIKLGLQNWVQETLDNLHYHPTKVPLESLHLLNNSSNKLKDPFITDFTAFDRLSKLVQYFDCIFKNLATIYNYTEYCTLVLRTNQLSVDGETFVDCEKTDWSDVHRKLWVSTICPISLHIKSINRRKRYNPLVLHSSDDSDNPRKRRSCLSINQSN
jgi:hypothetical protein